jgi:hypothetical protein
MEDGTTPGDADHIAMSVGRSNNDASRSEDSSGRSPSIPLSLLTHLLEAELESILQLVTSEGGHPSAQLLEKVMFHCNESLKYSSLLAGTAVTTER